MCVCTCTWRARSRNGPVLTYLGIHGSTRSQAPGMMAGLAGTGSDAVMMSRTRVRRLKMGSLRRLGRACIQTTAIADWVSFQFPRVSVSESD